MCRMQVFFIGLVMKDFFFGVGWVGIYPMFSPSIQLSMDTYSFPANTSLFAWVLFSVHPFQKNSSLMMHPKDNSRTLVVHINIVYLILKYRDRGYLITKI